MKLVAPKLIDKSDPFLFTVQRLKYELIHSIISKLMFDCFLILELLVEHGHSVFEFCNIPVAMDQFSEHGLMFTHLFP